MPVKGFKTITIKDTVYDYYFKLYDARKEQLALKGISSFSNYFIACLKRDITP